MFYIYRFIVLFVCFFESSLVFAGAKPVVLAEGYEHDKFVTQPRDIKEFRAYTSSFDSEDGGVILTEPEWVTYEVKKAPVDLGASPDRPSTWFTDTGLYLKGIAPKDESYIGSGYSRGHRCMKALAFRLGADADWNSHTVFNTCPQLQGLNAGAWLYLEELTGRWADDFQKVWVICGPVFLKKDIKYIGDAGEVKVAIPDAFYKIVVKNLGKDPSDVLVFIYEILYVK